jgi:uncharacterized membrane protein YcjF (UPF0283 family)
MKKMRLQVVVVMALGILVLLAVFFCHLALTDIYHGEPDVSLEWNIVQIAALIILIFIGSSIFTFGRILKVLNNKKNSKPVASLGS